MGPSRVSSSNTCWSRVGVAQPRWPRGQFCPCFPQGKPPHPGMGVAWGGPRELLSASLAGSSKTGSKAGDEPYAPTACEEPGARSRSRSLKPPTRPKASQSVQTPSCPPPQAFTVLLQLPEAAAGSSHGLGLCPHTGLSRQLPQTPLLSLPQSAEPRAHPQGRLPAPPVHSQDPAPHQVSPSMSPPRGVPAEPACPWHVPLAWPCTGTPRLSRWGSLGSKPPCPGRGWCG